VKNISSRGLAFVRDEPMKDSAQFLVYFSRQMKDPVQILCTVVHCESISDDMYAVGAEFTCLPTGSQLADPAEQARIRQSILG